MFEKVTVVVPVYNVENFILNCVNSIIGQTYSNLEIILVNDGSTDNSKIICQKLCSSDERISLINKVNGGLSSARNAGIDVASGDYIMFIDGDDWIDDDYVEQLVGSVKSNKSDIAVFHMKKESSPFSYKIVEKTSNGWVHLKKNDALRELFTNNNIGYSACNKIYSINLFKTIRYPDGKLMEDKATTYKLIDLADGGVNVSPLKKYHYYMRPTSIMKSKFNPKRFDSFDIHQEILAYMTEKHPGLVRLVQQRYVYEAIRMLMSLIESNDSDRKNYKKCISVIRKYRRSRSGQRSFKNILYWLMVDTIVVLPWSPFFLSKLRFVRFVFRKLELK